MSLKKLIMRVFAGIILLGGIGLMAFPLAGNLLFERRQENLSQYYEEIAANLPQEERSSQLEECDEYNRALKERGTFLADPFGDEKSNYSKTVYNSLLNLNGDGVMGSIEVPGITGNLVIYHSVEEEVLQKGVGHLPGSSLPVGGIGTHSVLSAHSGLSSKKLFTNLDRVEKGDVFYLHILGETLAYQVNRISIVLPTEALDDLRIDSNRDYVTLITCTPYGINSHRLLIRGTRIPYEEARQIEEEQMGSVSTWREKYIKAFFVGAGIISVIILIILMRRRTKQRRR